VRDKARVGDSHFDSSDASVSLKGVKIGVLQEFQVEELDPRNKAIQEKMVDLLREHGAEIVTISIPLVKYVLPYHYSLIPSEAASNLARFDGLRYGNTMDKREFLE